MTSISATSLRMPAIHLPASRQINARATGQAGPPQSASISFARSSTVGVDAVASVSDANLDASTTLLSLSLDLKANQKYSFSFYFPSGGPKVTLVDAAGKAAAVDMSKGFSVKSSGTYTLRFEAGYSLKTTGNFDNLKINAKSVLPTVSGDKRIDALITGGTGQWWHTYDAVASKGTDAIGKATALADGSSVTALTYSFMSTQPQGQAMNDFQPMSEAQKGAVRKAFDYYSKLINVTFTEVAGDGTGNINFGTNDQSSSAGYANLPNASAVKDKDFLYLANNVSTNNDQGVQEGGYGYTTILHEIGHTLGLKHPGNYNAGGGGAPGPYLSAKEDDHQHSVMSYNDNNASRGVNATSAMVYDIAALQYLYGANKSASTASDGKFTFSDNNTLKTLWSANGTDTIDLSALTSASNVNLNGGTYSDINIKGPAASTSYSGNQNVGIAYGAKIDKVKLSSTNGVAETVTLNNAYTRDGFNTITSFDAIDDKIGISKSVFGALKAGSIEFGTAATSTKTKFIVNRETGEIFYDADGSGAKSTAKKIAQYVAVQGRGEVTAANFVAVA
jgi:hypothetical protein